MTQKQETKKKEEKKDKEYKIVNKEKTKIYETKEFLDKLDECYNIYGTYKLVAKKLNEEFACSIDYHTVSKLYKKHIAIKIGTEKDASKFFEDSFIRMQKRWEESWEMIGDLVSEYKKFRKVIKERSGDDLTQALTFLRMAPQIISITEAIRKQLEFISKQQEEIKIYQQNNLIISPIQINQEIKQMFTKMSKQDIQAFFKSLGDERFAEFTREIDKNGN